jgi:hypothetical protein
VSAVNELNVSVGATYAFLQTDSGRRTTIQSRTQYTEAMRHIDDNLVAGAYGLPWPRYESTFWSYMVGPEYEDAEANVLATVMTPFYCIRQVPRSGPLVRARCEAFLHPFALTIVLHIALGRSHVWTANEDCAKALDATLRYEILGNRLSRGLPVDACPPLPDADADTLPYAPHRTSRFVLLTTLGDKSALKKLAYHLASRFTRIGSDPPSNTSAELLGSSGSAFSIHNDTIGIAMSREAFRAHSFASCYHRNIATLVAMLQNLGTLPGHAPTEATRWYQDRSALLLNCLSRGVSLPPTGPGVYKSMIAPRWIEQKGWITAIDGVARIAWPGVPSLSESAAR